MTGILRGARFILFRTFWSTTTEMVMIGSFVDLRAQANALTIDETAGMPANLLHVWSVTGLTS